ncbi:hypothetical protein [Nostoc sp.]|uniref:hypothetical protein n=1 Tax=Nostoc sp. TaxID=1180 RepID=UPI002FF50B71
MPNAQAVPEIYVIIYTQTSQQVEKRRIARRRHRFSLYNQFIAIKTDIKCLITRPHQAK